MNKSIAEIGVVKAYQLLTGLVAPRPIAWVTTLSPNGSVNLAPFSFFNLFGANPPIVVFSPTLNREGQKKDTLKNLELRGEFVINAATKDHAALINQSSATLPYGSSEVEMLKLATVPSTVVGPPRLAMVPWSLECKVRQILPMGNGPIAANLVIGEVVNLHLEDSVLDPNGLPDPGKLQSIARLGGEYWSRTTDLFTQERPA